MLVVNDMQFAKRAEIVWEKGTDRASFFRGESDKYDWVDIGSSFLPSEIIAAFLWAQIEHLDQIQERRKKLWNLYYEGLDQWASARDVRLPVIPDYATNNAHMFYMTCNSREQRDRVIDTLGENDILAVFHYLSLHKSRFFNGKHDGRVLPNADLYSERLVRLPFYYELEIRDQQKITDIIQSV